MPQFYYYVTQVDDADCIVTAIHDIYSGFKTRRWIATSGDTNELEKDDAQIEEQE